MTREEFEKLTQERRTRQIYPTEQDRKFFQGHSKPGSLRQYHVRQATEFDTFELLIGLNKSLNFITVVSRATFYHWTLPLDVGRFGPVVNSDSYARFVLGDLERGMRKEAAGGL